MKVNISAITDLQSQELLTRTLQASVKNKTNFVHILSHTAQILAKFSNLKTDNRSECITLCNCTNNQ